MEIATIVNAEQAKKIAFIQEKTKQNIEEILISALESYYEKILESPKTNFDKFNEIGFIGCIEAEPDLAENCESILLQEIGEIQ